MIHTVSVYCASSTKINSIYSDAASELGKLLGERRLKVFNGAGSMGLMRTLSDAVMSAGGIVTGVIPRFMVENGWGYEALNETIEVETMHERKQIMASASDAAIALPGGYGTLEELLEIITWKQLGLYIKPIIILNTEKYFDDLLSMFRHAVDEHFVHQQHARLWHVADTPSEVVELLFKDDPVEFIPKNVYKHQ